MSTNQIQKIIKTPADYIIQKVGVKRLSDWTGKSEVQVRRWAYPKERGGCGGIIPSDHIPTIVNRAREIGFDIRYSDFFHVPICEEVSC